MKKEIIRIDFDKNNLYGYETPKSRETIDSLISAIKQKIELPLFFVFEFEKGKYSLSPQEKIIVDGNEYIDGGHHRAIAFLEECSYVDVIKISKPNVPVYMLQKGYINIKNIPIINDYHEYLKRKQRYGNYL